MNQLKKSATVFLMTMFVFISCKKDKAVTPPTNTSPVTNNKPPLANAGTDQIITLPTDSTELSGSGTDVDGSIISYSWSKVSGPSSFTVVNPNIAITKLKNLVLGIYEFELTVTDNGGLSAKDTVRIIVNTTNKPPVANAGADQIIMFPVDSVKLNGSNSYDPDGSITSFLWRKISGYRSTFIDSNSAIIEVKFLDAGVYFFELTVIDNKGLPAKDTVQITVTITCPSKEYDLDITANCVYIFENNMPPTWFYDTYDYYDFTRIDGEGSFPPFGEMNIFIKEFADTAALSDKISSNFMAISKAYWSEEEIQGYLSGIYFKKIIREGGGPFTGTFTVVKGTAQRCDRAVFTNLLPLTVTGNLNVFTHAVNLTIKGKVYF